MDLTALFNTLQRPADPAIGNQRFAATVIPGYEHHRIAKDARGVPALLISVSNPKERGKSAPISLQHLIVQHNFQCRVLHLDGTSEDGQFTVVSFKGIDHALNNYFLQLLEPLVALLGPTPSREEVTQIISKMIDLFRVMELPPRKTVQGLWAELYIIARSNDPATLIKAWHSTPQGRYDFNAGNQRIEVKSASGRIRQHHFSIEQLQPPIGTDLLIASILIERSGNGTSLANLIEQIHKHISGNSSLTLHFDQAVAMTLGSGWRDSLQDTFDLELAEQDLAFYEYSVVPTVGSNLPAEISEVHFKADLTNKPHANYSRYRKFGGLFQAALK